MDYVKILSDLIAIDTRVPPGLNYARAMDYLEPIFHGLGFQTQQIAIPPHHASGLEGRLALIGHRKAAGKPRLIFYSHVDVVPAEGWNAWQACEKDGKLYGRGAADMKGGIVALLLAMDNLGPASLKYDISVMVTTDEEVNQADQLRYLKTYLEPVKGAHIFSLDSNFGYVSIAGLGALQMEIKVTGKSVHSGLCHLGVNAVELAVPVLEALLALKAEVTRKQSAIPASPDTGLAFMVPRLNINLIRGGLKVNIVPDECIIQVDRRLIPEENVETAEAEIRAALAAVEGVDWQATRLQFIPGTHQPADAMVNDLDAVLKKLTGEGGQYGEMGSGDLGSIAHDEWGAGYFGLGVIRSESNIHGRDEFVYLKDIEDVADVISTFIREPV